MDKISVTDKISTENLKREKMGFKKFLHESHI